MKLLRIWATNMTIGCGMSFVGAGTVVFYWLQANAPLLSLTHFVLGIYSM